MSNPTPMTATNEAALKLAREIAAGVHVKALEADWTGSEKAKLTARIADILGGRLDNSPEVQSALAAIERTTALAAANIDARHGFPTHEYELGYSDVLALRSYAHLKGPTDE